MARPKTKVTKEDQKKQELLNDKKEIESALEDANLPDDVRQNLKNALVAINKQLRNIEESQKKPPVTKQPKPVIKSRYQINGKNIEEVSVEEIMKGYQDRVGAAKAAGNKIKTKSPFSRITEQLTSIASSASTAIKAKDIKADPKQAINDFQEIGSIIETALVRIREILTPYLDSDDLELSASAKQELQSLEQFVINLKSKYQPQTV
jgi:hypothetical protein